jgi:hypothetical protein
MTLLKCYIYKQATAELCKLSLSLSSWVQGISNTNLQKHYECEQIILQSTYHHPEFTATFWLGKSRSTEFFNK